VHTPGFFAVAAASPLGAEALVSELLGLALLLGALLGADAEDALGRAALAPPLAPETAAMAFSSRSGALSNPASGVGGIGGGVMCVAIQLTDGERWSKVGQGPWRQMLTRVLLAFLWVTRALEVKRDDEGSRICDEKNHGVDGETRSGRDLFFVGSARSLLVPKRRTPP